MKTNILTGYFDCKKYNAKKPRDQWTLVGNDETITFSTTFPADAVPADLAEFAKWYTGKQGDARAVVKFKISASCRWYDANAQRMERPDNSVIDGKRYECAFTFRALYGDPNKKEAAGFWANDVLLREVEDNPFAEFAPAEPADVNDDPSYQIHTPEAVFAEPVQRNLPF